MAERFRDLMLERTGGRFRVVIYPSGQLGGERVAFEQIQVGAVHMAITGTPVLSGWVPETQIFDLPFLFETRDHGLAVSLRGVSPRWSRDPSRFDSPRTASYGPDRRSVSTPVLLGSSNLAASRPRRAGPPSLGTPSWPCSCLSVYDNIRG